MAAAAQSSAAPGRGASRAARLAPLAVCLLTILVFLPATRGEFVSWDDDQAFLANPHWRGFSAENARWALTTRHLGPWQPLAWLSLQLDFELWGEGPFGPHLGNVLWHALAAFAVCLCGRRLLAAAVPRAGPGALAAAAALGALLFALHPLRVESVAWATERRDVLSGFFVALSTLLWLAALEREGRPRRVGMALALVAHALALASKATAMPLPLVLLVLDFWPLRRARAAGGELGPWALLREKLPLFALSAAAGVIALGGQAEVDAFVDARLLGPLQRVSIACHALACYGLRTLWPSPLWPHYALPAGLDFSGARFVAPAVLVPLAGLALWLGRRRVPALAASLAIACLFVLPVSGLLQVGRQVAADRYTYLPGIALALLAAGAWLAGFERLSRGLPRILLALLAALVLAGLAARTQVQIDVWRDSETLWRHVLAHEPDSVPGRNNLANLLARRGDDAGALEHYQAAARLAPAEARIRANLARALARLGRDEEAASEAEQACELAPASAPTFLLAGTLRLRAGAPERALLALHEARRLAPELPAVRVRLAEALAELGRGEEARAELEAVLARLEGGAGVSAQAARALEGALRLARRHGWGSLGTRAQALVPARGSAAPEPRAEAEEW